MDVYIAICYDRHVDDTITAHSTKNSAIEACNIFMSYEGYAHYGEWDRECSIEDDRWVYALRFKMGGGPRARVEKTILITS